MAIREGNQMARFCFAPGRFITDRVDRQKLAEMVESIVDKNYADHLVLEGIGQLELFFPATGGQLDFFDLSIGRHRCDSMADFLKLHNPNINAATIRQTCLDSHPKPLGASRELRGCSSIVDW
jgi:hypothetical protein